MSEIKQEWLNEAREAAFVVATDDDVSTILRPQTTARAILKAVAPLIRADALREAAGECRTVMNTLGREMKDANPGPQITATYKIDGILQAEKAITALIDAPKIP